MAQFELNLRDYWQIIRKRQVVLLFVFFAVFIFSAIYTNLQHPVYQAVASVQWIERKTLGGLLTEMVTVRAGDPLVAQSRLITSLPVLENVVIELGLVSKDADAISITEKARELQGSVITDIITDTNIIRIIVKYKNPQGAALIANKIAKAYIIENLKEKSKQSRGVREFIETQLTEIGKKLKNSEEALAKFKQIEVPTGVALALQNRLGDLERHRQELLEIYTENHPDVRNAEEEVNRVKGLLKGMPQKELIFGRLTRDAEINSKLYRELKDKLEAARISEAEKVEDVSLVDQATPPGSPISPNKPLNYLLGIVMGLILGITGAFVYEQLDTSIGTIEDVEDHLKLPVLGIIPYLKTEDEKRKSFVQKFFPNKFKGLEKPIRSIDRLIINFSGSSPVFEAYRILRTKIQTDVFKEKIKGKIILISSSGPEEGKSITISNLAIAFAQGGLHTLLIDADLRRAVINKVFGLKDKEPGLSNILKGMSQPEDTIRTFTDLVMGEIGLDRALKIPGLDNLNILTSGSTTANSAELLSSLEMSDLLEKMRARFDVILIDSPPVLAVADAVILGSKADAVILVYKVGKTARSILVRSKTQLVESGAPVKGVILNNISPEVEMQYGHYYYYKYYGKYYGDKKE